MKLLSSISVRSVLDRLEAWGSIVLIGWVIWALGIFWKFPQGFLSTDHFPRLIDFLALCEDPFFRGLEEPIVAYRISLPAIYALLDTGPFLVGLSGMVFLILAYGGLWKFTSDQTNPLFGFLTTFVVSQTFFAHWSNRWIGYPDSFSHCCVIFSLLSKRPLPTAALVVIGTMNDERTLFAIPFVLLWHSVLPNWNAYPAGVVKALRWTMDYTRKNAGVLLGVLGAGLVVFLLRLGLKSGWLGPGIKTPAVYRGFSLHLSSFLQYEPYFSDWPKFLVNLLFSFSWSIFFIAPFFNYLYRTGGWFLSGLWVGFLLLAVFSTTLVIDVSRSLGFLFLFIPLGAIFSYRHEPHIATRTLMIVAALMALTPGLYFTGPSGAVFIPYPVDLANEALKAFLNVDILESMKQFFRD